MGMPGMLGLGKQTQKLMKRIILIFGGIAGAIMGGMLLITMPMYSSGTLDFDNGEILGYSTMIIAFAPMIFLGVKSYRDKELNGVISFWKAVQTGLLIYVVAAVVYATCWEITYSRIGDSFIQQMTEHKLDGMREKGASEAEIATTQKEWADFGEMYKNPVVRFGFSLLEPSPVGVIITLISAALLRRKEFLAAEPDNITTA